MTPSVNLIEIFFFHLLGIWEPWTDCSKSCGGGWKSRSHSGGGPGETASCNTQSCEGEVSREQLLTFKIYHDSLPCPVCTI